MGTFETKTTINASKTAVWSALADIGNIAAWNPGVIKSYVTSEQQSEGLGATRYCDLGGRNFLDEEVVKWEPENALTMRVTNTNMPFKTVDIRFILTPVAENKTEIVVSPIYELKYGPVGQLMDTLFIKSTYHKGMDSLLAGLKKYLEEQL
ncbi:MAG: SRPBCC family protein [Chloroflexota bacterium]